MGFSFGKLFKWFDYVLLTYFLYHAIAQESILAWVLAAIVALRRIYGYLPGGSAVYHLVDCKHRHGRDDGHSHHEGPIEPQLKRRSPHYRRPVHKA